MSQGQRRPRRRYENRWIRVRDAVLVRDGFVCWNCRGLAVTADHIVPKDEAPWLALEPSNLRATCKSCNSARVWPRMAKMARLNQRVPPERAW